MKRCMLFLSFVSLGLILSGCHSRKGVKSVESIAPVPAVQPNADQEPSLSKGETPEVRTVYFDYNKATIRSEDADILKKNYDGIVNHLEWELLIEGHCDERGTEAYNLALGEPGNTNTGVLHDLGSRACHGDYLLRQ